MATEHMSVTTLALTLLVLVLVSLQCQAAPGHRVSRSSGRLSDEEFCDIMCSKEIDFCPPSCPEAGLLSPMKKRFVESQVKNNQPSKPSVADYLKLTGHKQPA